MIAARSSCGGSRRRRAPRSDRRRPSRRRSAAPRPSGPARSAMKSTAATPLTTDSQDVLEAVEALDVVGQEYRQQRDHDDPLARPEVAAVDGRAEERQRQRPGLDGPPGVDARQGPERRGPIATSTRATPIRIGTMAAKAPGKARSSSAPVSPPAAGDDAEPKGAPALALQLAAIPERAADRARHEPDGVRDVGVDRRIAEGEQGGEGDQRARADDRVDRAAASPAPSIAVASIGVTVWPPSSDRRCLQSAGGVVRAPSQADRTEAGPSARSAFVRGPAGKPRPGREAAIGMAPLAPGNRTCASRRRRLRSAKREDGAVSSF